jgi:hypothetical protein
VEQKRTAALYGNSLFMAGVEASLRHRQGLAVTRIDAALPDAEDRLDALCPDVVIFDLDAPHAPFVISFLRQHPGLPLVGLALSGNDVMVLSSHQYTAMSSDDLAQVIQNIKKDETH